MTLRDMKLAAQNLAGLPHGFFTRRGGVSEGIYASLNCGPGSADDPGRVARNRARAMAELGLAPGALCTLHQEHGARVLTLDAPLGDSRPKADSMVSARPGLALGILTADCAPVLLADRMAGVIGACHAGWKGALGGVLGATIDAMTALGARRPAIAAAIGPCIGRQNYEVGPEFRAAFLASAAQNALFFAPAGRADHWLFDLPGFVSAGLRALGLEDIALLDADTYGQPARFFSFRRATHRGEADYGRQLSAIALPAL
jgi:YfiH family protein